MTATPYESVYSVFLHKIEDTMYATLDIEVLEDDLLNLLNAAIFNFDFPKIDLKSKNDTTQSFDNKLGFDEIQILGHLMAHEWLCRGLKNIELLQQSMSAQEWRSFSQANHINSLIKVQEADYQKIERMKKRYSRRLEGVSLLSQLGGTT